MITITSNINEVVNRIALRLDAINGKEIMNEVATNMLPELKYRIHTDGKKADGSAIGSYSSSYLKVRESKLKRGNDSKVVLSATRKLEQDTIVIPTEKGAAIGFNSTLSAQIVEGNEKGNSKRKGYGTIYALTKDEKDKVKELTKAIIKDAIHK